METRVQWAGRDARRRAAVEVDGNGERAEVRDVSRKELQLPGGHDKEDARSLRSSALHPEHAPMGESASLIRRVDAVAAQRCPRTSWSSNGHLMSNVLHRAERLESAQARLPIPNSEEALAQSGVPHTDLGVFPDFSQSLTAVGCKTSRVGRFARFARRQRRARDRLAVTDR
jgi:hypothetical protein